MVEDKELQAANFEERLESEKKRSEDYLNRLKYLQADFENLKKRFDREAEQIKCYSNERIIIQLLEVVDELELAIKNGEISTPSTSGLLEGVEMTLKKLRKVLEQEGVSEIPDPQGKTFDPSLHNAVIAVEKDDVEESTVIEQVRKGYTLRGRVIRPSIVKVAIKSKNQSKINNKMEENKQ
ncbi:MAG: nucleotide exchange factor GrpE [Candidatus Bathyarchaeota archaeon]|nr:nucleotide exchange factor GrpE [Candidatus Bathyarchaeota archaeon]